MTDSASYALKIGPGFLHLLIGDITEMKVDAIVNAANQYLHHGGGVAGAIVRKGGRIIQEESNKIGPISVGEAVLTTAGKLPASKVIHAVGPRLGEGKEEEKLKNATKNSLRLAKENNLKRIAFPAISTGIFGYPLDRCANIMLEECINFLKNNSEITDIYFCLWQKDSYDIFYETLLKLWGN